MKYKAVCVIFFIKINASYDMRLSVALVLFFSKKL